MLRKTISAEELICFADNFFDNENNVSKKQLASTFENNFDTTRISLTDVENISHSIDKISRKLNVRFSFTLMKSNDYNYQEHALFDLLCPRACRSIEISDYVNVKPTLIIKNHEPITIHFRSLYNAYGKKLFDIFPCGNSQEKSTHLLNRYITHPMNYYVGKRYDDLSLGFYDFFTNHYSVIVNVSFHYGISADFVTAAEDGHSKIAKNGIQFSRDTVVTTIADTIHKLKYYVDFIIGLPNCSLLGENLDYNQDIYPQNDGTKKLSSAYEYCCNPENINQLSKITETDLLVDIGHAIITIKNLYKQEPSPEALITYINELCKTEKDGVTFYDYSLITEVHFVVPSYVETIDTELSLQSGKIITTGHLRDYHDSFVEQKDDTHTPVLDIPIIREKEYRVAIEGLKHIISQRHNNYPKARRLIINIETASDKRDIAGELKMIVEELTSLLP